MTNNENQITDTSDVMTEHDYILVGNIKKLKKQLLQYIQVPILIEFIKDRISNSKYINFKNERSAKFINLQKPVFNILVNREAIRNDPQLKSGFINACKKTNGELSYFSNLVFDEIIAPTTKFINDSIKNDPELEDYIESSDIFRDCSQEERDLIRNSSIVSTLFGLRFLESDHSTIIVEMLL